MEENSDSIFLAKGVPFWDDLFSVTEEVPHWSMFALLAKDPTSPLLLQIPVTYIFLPGDKLTARLCTAKNGRLIIRRNCRESPVTFEMMESNLIECFNSRIGDGQPYVCTVYAKNAKPRIVTKQNFSLLCLYLRSSHGLSVSASYGRDEHARASGLFPENIMCVQAYVPLERPTRYISVFLRSPFATISEVYKNDVQHQDLRTGNDQMLTTLRDVYFPLSSEDSTVAKIRQQTSALLACIRQYHKVCLTGFVGEFVCDTEGRIYFTSVIRVSTPHVQYFSGNLREWHPPHVESIRIDTIPKIETSIGGVPSFRVKPLLRLNTTRTPRHNDGAQEPKTARPHDAKTVLSYQQGTPRASIMRATIRRRQSVASENYKNSLRISAQPNSYPINDMAAEPHVEKADEESKVAHLQGQGSGAAESGSSESLEARQNATSASQSVALERAPSSARQDRNLKGAATLDESPMAFAIEPRRDGTGLDTTDALALRTVADREGHGSRLPDHDLTKLRSPSLRKLDQTGGGHLEEEHAESSDASFRPGRDRATRARGGNLLCHRCGEEVPIDSDRPGWSHYEWRSRAATAAAGLAASRSSSRKAGRTSKRGKLESALDKIEKRMLGPGERREHVAEGEPVARTLTYCNTCLEELARNEQNRRLVEEIMRFRQGDTGSVFAGDTLPLSKPA